MPVRLFLYWALRYDPRAWTLESIHLQWPLTCQILQQAPGLQPDRLEGLSLGADGLVSTTAPHLNCKRYLYPSSAGHCAEPWELISAPNEMDTNSPYFTNEESETQRGPVTCFSHTASKRQSWDLNLGSVLLEPSPSPSGYLTLPSPSFLYSCQSCLP